MSDIFTDALTAPPGRLAEILLSKMQKGNRSELPDDLRMRLNKLVDAPGKAGCLARVRLAADLPFLFAKAPKWTKTKMLPFFDWSSQDAAYVWSSRTYSSSIGQPDLFNLTKESFLQIFGRNDIPRNELNKFAEWLPAILVANQSNGAGYKLQASEARAALRRAGANCLPSVAHQLAIEMGREPEVRGVRWRNVVGPVFEAIWPLDVELQTTATTFSLTQMLLATGDAFSEAADVVIPFIRPDDPHGHSTVFSIAGAPEQLYKAAPDKILDLLFAVVGDASPASVFGLDEALSRIRTADPNLTSTRKFQKLTNYAMTN